jgi:hypothetical protein
MFSRQPHKPTTKEPQMTVDTRRNMSHAAQPVTVIHRQLKRAKKKEDAGININADKPYNWAERLYLRFMSVVLARQLI